MANALPLKHPKPDARAFIDVLMGRERQVRPVLVEYLVDDEVMRPIVTELLGYQWVDEPADRAAMDLHLSNLVEFWYRMGYSFVRYERNLGFQLDRLCAPDPTVGSRKQRLWVKSQVGLISSWEEFERYPWPKPEDIDLHAFEYLSQHLREGMGLVASHEGGVFEHLSMLMSYEGLCYALHDNRKLVAAIAHKLGELMTAFYDAVLNMENVIALFPGDDMGFRTSTLVSPSDLREFILPWHNQFAQLAHSRGIPYFLHSCGNIIGIMDDLIADVHIDGKHSFEDAILPVEEFQLLYGQRIAVLGGLDVNTLASATTDTVRMRTRSLLETCVPRGRYAIGSGNSIPSYVPVTNYLAMLEEALNW